MTIDPRFFVDFHAPPGRPGARPRGSAGGRRQHVGDLPVISGGVDPVEVGPLHHHGPELFPVIDLIAGAGLPVAAALWLGRWRSIRARLTGGANQAAGRGVTEGDARGSPEGGLLIRPRRPL